jgi:hypothetical protein
LHRDPAMARHQIIFIIEKLFFFCYQPRHPRFNELFCILQEIKVGSKQAKVVVHGNNEEKIGVPYMQLYKVI